MLNRSRVVDGGLVPRLLPLWVRDQGPAVPNAARSVCQPGVPMGDKQCLCKWPKERFQKDLEELKKVVAKPKYVCTKCGRVARKKGYLCHPERI
jgi:hypothetical protein